MNLFSMKTAFFKKNRVKLCLLALNFEPFRFTTVNTSPTQKIKIKKFTNYACARLCAPLCACALRTVNYHYLSKILD